ncbi:hypothetical protein E2542_SST28650 [Spatholobus suberectus]|nr:hypothetical protein E2542_SST28650 [Spatholobus suberectus]
MLEDSYIIGTELIAGEVAAATGNTADMTVGGIHPDGAAAIGSTKFLPQRDATSSSDSQLYIVDELLGFLGFLVMQKR